MTVSLSLSPPPPPPPQEEEFTICHSSRHRAKVMTLYQEKKSHRRPD